MRSAEPALAERAGVLLWSDEMRVLFTATAYPPSTGGAQHHSHMLMRHLQGEHSVQVVSHWDTNRTDWLRGTTMLAPRRPRDYSIDGVQVHRIGLSLGERLGIAPWVPLYYPAMGRALPAIAALLERHLAPFAAKADLIHNVRIGREGLSQASLNLARRLGLPFAFTPIHHPRWVGWRYEAFWSIYREADLVLALTEVERSTLVAGGVRPERITITGIGPVLAPAVDPAGFCARYGIAGPLILFLGQHYAYKGFRQLLAAAPFVWARFPEAHFVFIGPPVRDSERVFADIDPRVHRLGIVDLQTKSDALAACSLLCVPSQQESFGGVYTEAWSYGRPVIGGDIPAIREVISDGVDGFLVRQDPHEIAERICTLLQDEALATMMGRAGQAKVVERYTWTAIARRVAAAYQRMIDGKPQL